MGKTVDMGGNPLKEQQPQQPKFNITDSVEMKCAVCGGTVFVSGIKFRKISKLLTGQPADTVIPLEVYLCGNCGEINSELYIEVLKSIGVKEK